jgi:MoxR-like ATPase
MQPDPSRPAAFPSPPGVGESGRSVPVPAGGPARPGQRAQEYAARVPAPIEQLLFEVKRLIVGQDRMLERLLVALLAGGHVLLEGVPGLAKTATVKAFAQVIGGQAGRIQFTPDLVPADLVGTRIYNPSTAQFSTELGPVFCNLLLADEINRAPAKVQSALLEVMQEQQVTIGKETFAVPRPFLVLATQNPIETDGTYPLPEAQIDRFMFKVLVGYPSFPEEVVVVQRVTGAPIDLRQVVTVGQLEEMQRSAAAVYVDPAVVGYAATLATATRQPSSMGLSQFAPAIAYGASPRASINMVAAARALAFIRGRTYVLPMDVAEVAPEVLRHRLVLSYEGIASGVSAEAIVESLLERYAPPRMDLGDRLAT